MRRAGTSNMLFILLGLSSVRFILQIRVSKKSAWLRIRVASFFPICWSCSFVAIYVLIIYNWGIKIRTCISRPTCKIGWQGHQYELLTKKPSFYNVILFYNYAGKIRRVIKFARRGSSSIFWLVDGSGMVIASDDFTVATELKLGPGVSRGYHAVRTHIFTLNSSWENVCKRN